MSLFGKCFSCSYGNLSTITRLISVILLKEKFDIKSVKRVFNCGSDRVRAMFVNSEKQARFVSLIRRASVFETMLLSQVGLLIRRGKAVQLFGAFTTRTVE